MFARLGFEPRDILRGCSFIGCMAGAAVVGVISEFVYGPSMLNYPKSKSLEPLILGGWIGVAIGVGVGAKLQHYFYPEDEAPFDALDEAPFDALQVEPLDPNEYPSMSVTEGKQLALASENRHEKTLREAGFNGDVPQEFQDIVTGSIMENPVIFRTTNDDTSHHVDISTIKILKQDRDPISRDEFKGYIIDRELKEAIERWVKEQVKLEKEKRDIYSFSKALQKVGQFSLKDHTKNNNTDDEKKWLRRSR